MEVPELQYLCWDRVPMFLVTTAIPSTTMGACYVAAHLLRGQHNRCGGPTVTNLPKAIVLSCQPPDGW